MTDFMSVPYYVAGRDVEMKCVVYFCLETDTPTPCVTVWRIEEYVANTIDSDMTYVDLEVEIEGGAGSLHTLEFVVKPHNLFRFYRHGISPQDTAITETPVVHYELWCQQTEMIDE